jgi:hypothetical protein
MIFINRTFLHFNNCLWLHITVSYAQELVTMAPAVWRWTFGRPTVWLLPTPLTLARPQVATAYTPPPIIASPQAACLHTSPLSHHRQPLPTPLIPFRPQVANGFTSPMSLSRHTFPLPTPLTPVRLQVATGFTHHHCQTLDSHYLHHSPPVRPQVSSGFT